MPSVASIRLNLALVLANRPHIVQCLRKAHGGTGFRRPSKTGTTTEVVGLAGSGQAGAIRSVVEDAMSFNAAEVSKVVDKQGKPLVVHHGTTGDISSFDVARLGEAWRRSSPPCAYRDRRYCQGGSARMTL